jgi:tryptophan 7-halogenase
MTAIEPLNPHSDDGRLRRIVIVGGGSAGWMAAAALSRITSTPIVLIESDEIGTVGVGEATIPQIRTFNQALGLDEREFLRETKGTFKLGIRFLGWNGEGSDYSHAFGQVGRHSGIVPFHQTWIRAHHRGLAASFGAYSLNDVAARAGKMAMPGAGLSPQGVNMPWAYHFDASLYAAYLRRLAEANGVTSVEGKVAGVSVGTDGQTITGLTVDDGGFLEGDFFLDCTGFRGLLISELQGSEFCDWSKWLPCNSALAAPCSSDKPTTPYTTSTAHKAGWIWRIPLQHRVGNGIVYCSDVMDDDEAHRLLLAQMDRSPDVQPRQIRFTTGTRRQHWIGNCLALGLSAGFLEPLESTSIHLIQYSIARLMAMLPRRSIDPAMQSAFNDEISRQWLRVRDFLILHYWANGRTGEPFWDACRDCELPATLKSKIAQFRAAGHFIREDDELFTEVAWAQVFIGQGLIPENWNPLADEIDEKQLRESLETMRHQHEQLVANMPSHDQFIQGFIQG